ncbi:MAG: hypothetical protein KAT43_01740 [Nanoarchaeota archaeon]|nr:hypothetical protein [Nanoarchaeota archaeon]
MRKERLFWFSVIFSLAFILFFPMVFAGQIANWYAVADWELEVCQKWGGTGTEEGSVSGRFRAQTDIVQSTTITLQARKTLPPQTTPQDVTYELAWYVEPAFASIAFNLYLKGPPNLLVANGTADFQAPSSGYWSGDLPGNYSEAILNYGTADSLIVPIICVNCG